MMIELIVADDHPTIRTGLFLLLENIPDINFIGEAESGIKAIEHTVALKPDILLLDYRLPDMSGKEVTVVIRQLDLKTRVLGFSGFSDIDHVIEMLDAGAMGYVLKTESPNMIFGAIRSIARGETWVSPSLSDKLLSRERRKSMIHSILSQREIEVLKLLARGKSNNQIAQSLIISSATVRNHLSNIYNNLSVSSRAEAITWAWSNGLIKEETSIYK